jgi:hypothetical protein
VIQETRSKLSRVKQARLKYPDIRRRTKHAFVNSYILSLLQSSRVQRYSDFREGHFETEYEAVVVDIWAPWRFTYFRADPCRDCCCCVIFHCSNCCTILFA